MRRLLAIATVGLFLAAMPVFAQRGGGGHGGFAGGHGGFAGHGGSGGGRVAMGRSFGGVGSRAGSFSSPSFHGQFGVRSFNGFRGPFIRNFDRNRFGYGYGYGRGRWGWGYPWLYGDDPYWWSDNGYSYDQDYENDRAMAEQMNEQSLEEQRMRQQQDQDAYAPPYRPAPQRREQADAESPVPPTVLVFHDQHKQEVQNYAIVGQTLWAFAPQRTQKIPLSELDIPATTKANDDRGVDFRIPAANGQSSSPGPAHETYPAPKASPQRSS